MVFLSEARVEPAWASAHGEEKPERWELVMESKAVQSTKLSLQNRALSTPALACAKHLNLEVVFLHLIAALPMVRL